jgi:hypothetical protein
MGFESTAFARKAGNGVKLREVERKEMHTSALTDSSQQMTPLPFRTGGMIEPEPAPNVPSRMEYPTRSVRRASGFVQTPIWRANHLTHRFSKQRDRPPAD